MISEAQATTGCTEGNCNGGTGTYVYANGTIEKGQFDTDEYLLTGQIIWKDKSYLNIEFKDRTSEGTIIYTNTNGFKTPSMVGVYDNDSGHLAPKINITDNWATGFEKWKSEQQCVANYKGVRPDKFGEESYRFVIDKPDGSQYIFYDNNKIVISKDGKILKKGDYKC